MRHRLAVVLPTYVVLYAACYYTAFLLRFDFAPDARYVDLFRRSLPFLIAYKLAASFATNEWRRTFRYATLTDVVYVIVCATASAALMYLTNLVVFFDGIVPRSVILIDWSLTILAGGLMRTGFRLYSETVRGLLTRSGQQNTLIYAADKDGIGMLRALQASQSGFRVVGFVDEKVKDQNELIAGIPVYSASCGWSKLASRSGAQYVLIPGTVPGGKVREILERCSEANLKTHVIPSVEEIVDGRYKLTVRDVTISDLLRREPAELDLASIEKYVSGRRVLVTGAAGSIGSELCRQLLTLHPGALILLDRSETGMFELSGELQAAAAGIPVYPLIGDVTSRESIGRVFEAHRPELVFHAAAYKHVPLMEANPQEAVRNNTFGTRTVADWANQTGVERFVFISTDKAVRPSSVMGATKYIAERYLQALSAQSRTQFMTVRFGNVLNSAGSVIPIFRRQIEAGGPITVTHPDMKRYFMTIPEAVQLVLQAGALGSSGDVLILDMGEPVRIVDLAKDMIFLSGLEYPNDIEIVYTGVRPGEKLFEELLYETEQGVEKVHEKIFCARNANANRWKSDDVQEDLRRLHEAANASVEQTRDVLKSVVDRYLKAAGAPGQSIRPAA